MLTTGDADPVAFDVNATKELIREATRVRASGANESVTRQTLVARLNDMYPVAVRPWWIDAHIAGAEKALAFTEAGRERRGFGDSVVGLTAIEYEKDLRNPALLAIGTNQVRQYCAGLLNEGADPDRVRGVLSDAVEWRGFRLDLAAMTVTGRTTPYDVGDVVLMAPEIVICNIPDEDSAERLASILARYLGRAGTRPLTGVSIASYLGFDATLGARHLADLTRAVGDEMATGGETGALVRELWAAFVRYLSVEPGVTAFDLDSYVEELYLAIVARLLCANVIARRPLRSDDAELEAILNGRHFEAQGLRRLVEYDYFGWLTAPTRVGRILPTARAIQRDLAAFDVEARVGEDVFGQMMSALAQRTRRLLLGQEWTPAWLANQLASELLDGLPPDADPCFVDMCCGSGAMLVAVTREAGRRLRGKAVEPGDRAALDWLVQSATGFDIDPVAVTLAKVNWVVANRDWLEPLDGSHPVSVPVYHADSLFAVGPVFDPARATRRGGPPISILIDGEAIDLPPFLITGDASSLFDSIVEGSYALALALGTGEPGATEAQERAAVADAAAATGRTLTEAQRAEAQRFAGAFATRVARLQSQGRNGIWSFVVRNSLRPGLLAGRFNGLISNPPWLAMSRIADNPFEVVLRQKAEEYGLVPPGSAFLHLEMSTVFLAQAIDRYLEPDAVIGCIVPDTVRNGMQHGPLRVQVSGLDEDPRMRLRLSQLWMVDADVFKNRAAIVFGRKDEPNVVDRIPGRAVGPLRSVPIESYVARRGDRLVWSPNPPGEGIPGGYPAGFAHQGADLMPRRLVMVTARTVGTDRVAVSTPVRGGPDWYLLSDGKKHQTFTLTPRTLPQRVVHKCLLSKHVAPFFFSEPASVVLPIAWDPANRRWRRLADTEIATSPDARDHFAEVVRASDYASLDEWWEALDIRGKLSRQLMPPDHWLVAYGAGGSFPAAAYKRLADFGPEPPVLDQTLYWIVVDGEEEAAYLTGVVNSAVLRETIDGFIPEGAFGPRHLHTLPSKTIPQFDPADVTHMRVAAAVQALASDVVALATRPECAGLFQASDGLASRRSRLRALISDLPTYAEYDSACRGVF